MPIILSHTSSMEVLRAIPPQTGVLRRVTDPVSLAELSPAPREASNFDPSAFGAVQHPFHVLVSAEKSSPKVNGVAVHTCASHTLPAGALMQVSQDVYVCSPELTFVQLSARVSPLAAITLGYELCGGYSHFARLVSGFYDREPLTSTKLIAETAGSLRGMRGVKKARQALVRVCDGARSPMETVVSCMLLLPAEMGGLGLKDPVLNHRVKLDGASARLAGTRSCSIDLAWPDERIGVEYDSAAFHSDTAKDRRRREALTHMGWQMYAVELDAIRDYASFAGMTELFAGSVARKKGGSASVEEQHALLGRLLRLTRCGLGLDAALFAVAPRRGSVNVHV